MYLYKKNGNNIDVYSVQPDEDKFRDFRKKEMENFSIKEKVLKASTNGELILSNDCSRVCWYHLLHEEYNPYGNSPFHEVSPYLHSEEEEERQKNLLQQYIAGDFDDVKVVKVLAKGEKDKEYYDIPKEVEYLLITKDYVEKGYTCGYSVMDDIIVLTKPLYLQELLNIALRKGDYSKVYNEDIDRQLQNYIIGEKPVKTVSTNSIYDMFYTHLIDGDYYQLMSKVEQSDMILRKVLK